MVNYTLQSLTGLIKKCCIAEKADDLSARYSFHIDLVQLNNMLKQKKTNLHVMAFDRIKNSFVPGIEDIQLLSEYLHDKNMFKSTFDGKSQVATFMLYSTVNENGEISLMYTKEDGSVDKYSEKDLFSFCNNPDSLDTSIITSIANNMPMYRVIVIRYFNETNEKFDYKVNIRSNFDMVTFQKSIKPEITE